MGDWQIVVAATDKVGNTDPQAAATSIRCDGPMLYEVNDLAIDLAHDRALVVDAYQRALFGVDLASSARFTISGLDAALGPVFSLPSAVAVDGGTTAWVVDSAAQAVFKVDLATGVRGIISSASVGVGPKFVSPRALAYDRIEDRLFVTSGVPADTILAVDLDTGDRSVVTGPNVGKGIPLASICDLEAGGPHGMILVTDNVLHCVVAVSPWGGDRRIISGGLVGTGVEFSNPSSCGLDATNGRLLVSDDDLASVLAVKLETGERSVLASASHGSGTDLLQVRGLVWDASTSHVFAARSNELFRIDPVTGDREPWSSARRGTGESFAAASAIVRDEARDVLYVVDTSGLDSTLLTVHPATGKRLPIATLTGTDVPGARGIEIDRGHNAVLTLGQANQPGESSIFGFGLEKLMKYEVGPFPLDAAAVIDVTGRVGGYSMLLATDSALYTLDLSKGALMLLSGDSAGSGPALSGIERVAVHPGGAWAFATQFATGSPDNGLVSIRLTDGTRQIVSSNMVGTGPEFEAPAGLIVDGENRTAYVVDTAASAIFRIDLATGDRTTISRSIAPPTLGLLGSVSLVGNGPVLAAPIDITLDLQRHVAFTTHGYPVGGVLAVDLASGDRVLISR